jgi:DMSO/TMAO reductase YedYZ heme-binding membrane subunit
MPSALFLSAAKHRQTIIAVFKVLYVAIILFTILGGISLYRFDDYALFFVKSSRTLGQAAILLYIATVIPGIFRRFKKYNEVVSLLMMYRRYLGILMFLCVFAHSWFNLGVEVIKGYIPTSLPLYLLAGVSAEVLLIILAFTSNDLATKWLGIWWSRIHSLTYIILWLIFLHVVLIDKFSIWTILVGATGILVVLSHIYKKTKR